eukprot:GILI01007358.1.p1 GENE.GILI01007358.1~~GILI01007358.1.p1  ORF type:complete len:167 (-),score=21.57 GILI01007358.1:253-753(-)
MEPNPDHLNFYFATAANSVTQLYKASLRVQKRAYDRGVKEAYEEMLQWVLTHQKGAHSKSLIEFIQTKIGAGHPGAVRADIEGEVEQEEESGDEVDGLEGADELGVLPSGPVSAEPVALPVSLGPDRRRPGRRTFSGMYEFSSDSPPSPSSSLEREFKRTRIVPFQ